MVNYEKKIAQLKEIINKITAERSRLQAELRHLKKMKKAEENRRKQR